MNTCSRCGEPCKDGAKFCENCGNPMEQAFPADSGQFQDGSGYGQPNYGGGGSSYGIQPRSIPLAVILSIVTCGIYAIYWMIKVNDEVNQLAGEPNATSGGMVFLFSMITCGIYTFFWMYKMGERCDRIKGAPGSSGILYLILSFFGLGIVSYCLIQDTINKAV